MIYETPSRKLGGLGAGARSVIKPGSAILNASANFCGPLGRRLFPHLIDQRAREDPQRAFYVLTEGLTEQKRRIVTYADFARAIDRAATWLVKNLGVSPGSTTVAYMTQDPYDLRYFIMLVAGMKTGYPMLLPSPRNSEGNNRHLLRLTSCKIIISDVPIDSLVQQTDARQIEPPNLGTFLAAGSHEPYAYTKTYEEAEADVAFILHSSGTTGPPKPIAWTHGKLGAVELYSKINTPSGERRVLDCYKTPGPHFNTLPFFHAGGFNYHFFWNVVFGEAHMSLPSGVMPTAETSTQFLKTYKPTSFYAAPSLLEDMASDEDMLAALDGLRFVCFTGAPIDDHAGQIINERVPLYPHCGSTECSSYPNFISLDSKAVNYFYWSPAIQGVEFRDRGGLFELIYRRNESLDWAVFHQFPDLDEYATKDLYEEHPTLKNHWKMVARTDDVLVLSNGEKVVPLTMESILRRCPFVKDALVLGQKRFSIAALLELDDATTTGWTRGQIIDRLTAFVHEANESSPSHARLFLDRILFTEQEKPMLRTAKGSIRRNQTMALYEREIDALYNGLESCQGSNNTPLVAGLNSEGTEQSLLRTISNTTSKKLEPEQDFFQMGLDSGHVLALVRRIRCALQAEGFESIAPQTSPSMLYSNPTARSLASALRNFAYGIKATQPQGRECRIRDMIKKYSDGFAKAERVYEPERSPIKSENRSVMLTGSTGSLGSYLLHELICDASICRIYALNRSNDAETRQKCSNASRGLSADFSKVTFIEASFEHHLLGFDIEQYHKIAESIDLILHNAWPVNFKQPLSFFEPHIAGVRHLIDLTMSSSRAARLLFVSSIGTTGNWNRMHPKKGAPEVLIDDVNVPHEQGYAESKYVSEHILAAAARAGLRAAVCRVGQIAGPVERKEGVWNKHEWVPTLIQSSRYLRMLPERLGHAQDNVDWVPADLMAKMLVEIGDHVVRRASDPDCRRVDVFNLVNRTAVDWNNILPAIIKHMPRETTAVSFDEWLDALKASSEVAEVDITKNPAVKLMEFWHALQAGSHPSGLVTEKACRASKTMRTAESVNAEWMERWMEQWEFQAC